MYGMYMLTADVLMLLTCMLTADVNVLVVLADSKNKKKMNSGSELCGLGQNINLKQREVAWRQTLKYVRHRFVSCGLGFIFSKFTSIYCKTGNFRVQDIFADFARG